MGCAEVGTAHSIEWWWGRLFLEEQRSHFLEAATPCKEFVSCSVGNVGYGVETGSLQILN